MSTRREPTTKQARAYTREVSPPSTTWWVPPHPSLARRKGRAHRRLWALHLGMQVSQGGACEGRREAPGRLGLILCPLLRGEILIDDRIGAKLQTRHDKRSGSGGEWLGKSEHTDL